MKKGATTDACAMEHNTKIIALRNEKGSYNCFHIKKIPCIIIALRNEKGSYNMGG